MKIKRDTPHWDHCNTSMEILWDRIEKYFEKKYPQIKARYYCDYQKGMTKIDENEPVVDVITFGDTFKKMFDSALFTNEKFRFWQLSYAFKKMHETLFFKENHSVNFIDRYDLFENKKAYNVDFSRPMELVYAGRLSAQKNIKFLLHFVNSLQSIGIDCNLHLFGRFDNMFHENLGRREHSNYQKEVERLCHELEWKFKKPHFHGHVQANEWVKSSFSQPVFITMSTYFCEDFGVSIAQAQEFGWPIICSNFSAHKDLVSDQIFFVPLSLMANDHLSEDFIRLQAQRLANYFNEFKFSKSMIENRDANRLKVHELSDLDSKRRDLSRLLNTSGPLLFHEQLDAFSDTQSGGLLIEKALQQLEQLPIFSFVISASDVSELSEKEAKLVVERLKDHLVNYKLIPSWQLNFKDKIMILMNSRKVFVLSSDKELIRANLEEKLGLSSIIEYLE